MIASTILDNTLNMIITPFRCIASRSHSMIIISKVLTFVNPCNIIQVDKLDSVLNMGYCGADYSAVVVFILQTNLFAGSDERLYQLLRLYFSTSASPQLMLLVRVKHGEYLHISQMGSDSYRTILNIYVVHQHQYHRYRPYVNY